MNQYNYIIDAFTKTEENVNLEVNNLNVGCITSKNNNFNIDSDGNLTVNSINAQHGMMSQQTIINLIYPVGSIYMSINSTSPAILFGGTWERINGRFLLGCGDNGDGYDYAPNSVGGSPSHKHTIGIGSTNDGYLTFNMSLLTNGEVAENENWGGRLTPASGIGIQNYDIKKSYTSTAGYNESLPPYLALYIWKRIN